MEDRNPSHKEKEEFGPVFSRIYSFFAGRSRKHREVYSRISSDIVALNPKRILEIGSGPGIAAAMIAQRLPDTSITCIDPSSTMVKIANRRFEKLSLSTRVHCSQGNSSDPGISGSFDAIFSSLSFHHWENGMEDLTRLISDHMHDGTFTIYENLLEGSGNGEKQGHSHGISLKFAESIEIPGVNKTFETTGGLVALRFSNHAEHPSHHGP